MSAKPSLQRQLGRLVELEQLRLERQQAALVAQARLCERVQLTVQRLEALGSHASLASLHPSLALNSAAYKDTMLAWARQQRQELERREVELTQARQQALAQARKTESLGLLLTRVDQQARCEQRRREQKRQDEIAQQGRLGGLHGQAWGSDV